MMCYCCLQLPGGRVWIHASPRCAMLKRQPAGTNGKCKFCLRVSKSPDSELVLMSHMLEIGRALRPGVGPSGPQKFFPT